MLFPTINYVLFFLAAFPLAWATHRHLRSHKWVLLALSWAFYALGDWRFLPFLIGISAFATVVSTTLQDEERPRARAALLFFGVAACLGSLGLFKYLPFTTASISWLLEGLGLHKRPMRFHEFALPVGVSFFVFHAISLMVDTYRAKIPVRVKVLDGLLYVAFFPQLVAGPILRAASFLPQLQQTRDATSIEAGRALQLITLGLIKKVLIAQVLATQLVDPVFESPASHSGLEVLFGVYGYAVQIFCDFSGYSDIAIGSALLLGYEIPANFNAPYRASSPQEFWRRWHISLSSWFRDYLFIPLGGSRGAHTARNIMITMVLAGLWHGAGVSFLAWGALHGVGLLVHRQWAHSTVAWIGRLRASSAWRWLAPMLTFHFVCLGWVFFRAPSLSAAGELLSSFGNGGRPALLSVGVLLAIAIGLFAPLVTSEPWFARVRRWPPLAQGALAAAVVLLIDALGPRGIAPFIYFRF